MRKLAASTALATVLAMPGLVPAAELRTPEDNIELCGSEICGSAAWSWFVYCWTSSGVPKLLGLQQANQDWKLTTELRYSDPIRKFGTYVDYQAGGPFIGQQVGQQQQLQAQAPPVHQQQQQQTKQPPQQQAPVQQAQPQLPAQPGQWVDATGKPVPVGPEGTRPGLFDANQAFNPNTGKSYVKDKNGNWKDEKTGQIVPEIPVNTKLDPSDPKTATHPGTGKKYTQVTGPQSPPSQQQNQTPPSGEPELSPEAKATMKAALEAPGPNEEYFRALEAAEANMISDAEIVRQLLNRQLKSAREEQQTLRDKLPGLQTDVDRKLHELHMLTLTEGGRAAGTDTHKAANAAEEALKEVEKKLEETARTIDQKLDALNKLGAADPPKPVEQKAPAKAGSSAKSPAQAATQSKAAGAQWVDESGRPVQTGPEGTRTGLFDPNRALNPSTGKSYIRDKDGNWKDEKTGQVVRAIPINTRVDAKNPNRAIQAGTGKTFTRGDGGAAPQAGLPPAGAQKPATSGVGIDQAVQNKRAERDQLSRQFSAEQSKLYSIYGQPSGPEHQAQRERMQNSASAWFKAEAELRRLEHAQKLAKQRPVTPRRSELHAVPVRETTGQGGTQSRQQPQLTPKLQGELKAAQAKQQALQTKRKELDANFDRRELAYLKSGGKEGSKEKRERDSAKAALEKNEKALEDIAKWIDALNNAKPENFEFLEKQIVVRAWAERVVFEQDLLHQLQAAGNTPAPLLDAQKAKFSAALQKWQMADEAANRPREIETKVQPPELQPSEVFPKDPKPPSDNLQEAGVNTGQPQFINVAFIAEGWTLPDPAKPNEPRNSMVSLQPVSTPEPAGIGEKRDDEGYDKDPLVSLLAQGLGLVRVPFEERALFGMANVREYLRPDSGIGADLNFIIGLQQARVSQYIIDPSGRPDIVQLKSAPPVGIGLVQQSFNFGEGTNIRISVFEAQAMISSLRALDRLAQWYDVDTIDVVIDWCWQKLPAHDLNPASSTARGRELPQAELKIGRFPRTRSAAR
jgi:hypothetical protein